MNNIIIYGNSVYAELIFTYFKNDSPYEPVCFCVDSSYITSPELLGLPVVSFDSVQDVYPPSENFIAVSIGFQKLNQLRADRYFEAIKKGYQLVNYISSRATIFPDLNVGNNCFIFENSLIHPFVEIGNDVTIASGAMIGHHSILKDHCFVAPGAIVLGGVTIEPYSFIGANACIKEKTTIAAECVIGSGVFITRDTKEKGIYINQPPELLKKRSDELSDFIMRPPKIKAI